MRAIVLGSGAGGAFPQWNCGCANCDAVRAGKPGWLARTQDSVAVNAGGERFVLVNTSPDILQQLQRTRELWPRAPRHSPIAAIVLTNGDMDHVLGLFSLRESYPLALYVTPAVWRGLEESAFIRTMQRFPGHLVVRPLALGETVRLEDAKGAALDLSMRAIAAAGKAPIHSRAPASPEDNIALSFSNGITYAAACASADVALGDADVVLFDGTFYREDELVRLGLSKSFARDMAHVPITESLGKIRAKRRIYTHINNSNPILAPDSEERRTVEQAGWEIAFDGLVI
jgi:pyrroloquinoline quinone biosynthesis protein B